MDGAVRHPSSQKIARCSADCENSKADRVSGDGRYSGKRKAPTNALSCALVLLNSAWDESVSG